MRIDVLNVGIDKIIVDNTFDETYTVNDIQNSTLPLGEIMSIIPTNPNGNVVKIITENKNEYDLTTN